MKLGELKATIRAHAGAPKIYVQIGGVMRAELDVSKGVLLEQLDMAFPGGKATETGLVLLESGFLGKEPSWPTAAPMEGQE